MSPRELAHLINLFFFPWGKLMYNIWQGAWDTNPRHRSQFLKNKNKNKTCMQNCLSKTYSIARTICEEY